MLYRPREISIFATNKCNYNCWFCKRTSGELDKTKDLDLKYVDIALNKYPSIESACIAGFGEPLLYPGLTDLVNMLKDRGIRTNMITNGSLILKNKPVLKKLRLDNISVSLNSHNKVQYERAHGVKLDFEKVVKGINWLYDNTNIEVNVSFVVNKWTYSYIPEYLVLPIECHTIDFYNLLPHNKEYWNCTIKAQNMIVNSDLEVMKASYKDPRIRNWPKPLDYRKEPGKCQLCKYHMLLSPDGYVSCCARVMPPTNKDAHICDQDPFNSAQCEAIRDNVSTNRECIECFGNYD